MGSTVSKQVLKKLIVSRPVERFRRLQLWEHLKPVVTRLMSSVGFGEKNPVGTLPTPQPSVEPPAPVDKDDAPKPHVDNPSKGNEDDGMKASNTPEQDIHDHIKANEDDEVENSRKQIEEALPVGKTEIGKTPNEQSHPQGERSQSVEILGTNLDVVQSIQSLIERTAPNLEKPNVPEPDKNAPKEAQDTYVAEYIISTLKVALPSSKMLPTTTRLVPSELPDEGRDFQTLTYAKSEIANAGTSADAVSANQLGAAPPLSYRTDEELRDLRRNYETWDDTKIYSGLVLDSESIRLVAILPGTSDDLEVELFKQPLNETQSTYEALSYVWQPTKPARTLKVNGIVVQVNPNAFDALLTLRLTDAKRRIWIDAICIRQTDRRELSTEVLKMGDIYRLAKTVVVFLGIPPPPPSSSSIRDFFKFLNRVGSGSSAAESLDEEMPDIDLLCQTSGTDKSAVCKGFVEFCVRPWWTRVWVLQEFYLATDEPVWYWGHEHANNAALKRDINLIMATSLDLYWEEDDRPTVQNIIKKPMPQFRNDVRRIADLISRRKVTNGYDNPSRLYRELTANAGDPRDKVYGLRQLFSPVFRKVFVPDYFIDPKLLYACLTVFLIQVESWGDVLWWYPFRFLDNQHQLPSWLPDFTRRVMPHESDLRPLDPVPLSMNQPKLVVLNHALHAEGYELDRIEGHIYIGIADFDVHRSLWRFDQVIGRNQTYLDYVITEDERQEPWLGIFLELCRETSSGQSDHGIAHSKAPLLEWTTCFRSLEDVPPTVTDSLPSWDLLIESAFIGGCEGTPRQEEDPDTDAAPPLLEGIFSPRMESAFYKTLAMDFIGACVFDWINLEVVLDRLMNASPWSQAESIDWQPHPELSSSNQLERVRFLTRYVQTFLTDVGEKVGFSACGGLHYYTGLCIAILLDCDDHAAFRRIVTALMWSGAKLRDIECGKRTHEAMMELGKGDQVVKARIRSWISTTDKFQGRFLFWTQKGFHGLSSPGVEYCGNTVVLLDGLSFPMIVRDPDEKSGCLRLAGCAIMRSVDMQGGNDGGPRVPAGFSLKDKTSFQFT